MRNALCFFNSHRRSSANLSVYVKLFYYIANLTACQLIIVPNFPFWQIQFQRLSYIGKMYPPTIALLQSAYIFVPFVKRYSLGDLPLIFLKIRLKLLTLPKPLSKAISVNVFAGSEIISHAASNRHMLRNSLKFIMKNL